MATGFIADNHVKKSVMSKVETLIQEIRALDPEDLQKVLQELLEQADRLQLAKDA